MAKPQHVLNVYFGVPGSGKTTFAAHLARKEMRRKRPVWSNVPITGTYEIDIQRDLGKFMISDGKLIVDEAGIEHNNRSYKSMPLHQIEWYKYHRHYRMSVDVFSQSHEDMDVTLRRLAQNFFVVTKSLIPWHIKVRPIKRYIDIDEHTKQIIDAYRFKSFLSTKRIFSPPLWKLFNTHSCKNLPVKDWAKW